MSAHDADPEFSEWLTARWPSVVRSLVFLGYRTREAERLALEGLADLQPAWDRLRREDDVDVELHRVVRTRRLHDAREGPDPNRAVEAPPGLADQAECLARVRSALSALPAADLEQLVLEHVAELSPDQVADVLGDRPPVTGPPAADLRYAAEAVPVGAVRAADVVARVRERRRRTRRRVALGVVFLLLVAGFTTWWRAPSEVPRGEVRRAGNPLPVPWYADGVLHLADVTVELPSVRDLVQVPDGVVLSDDDGAVWFVDGKGGQERIGRTVPGDDLVVEPDNGWVAWADPGAGAPELVVHDTVAGSEVGRRSLALPGVGGGQPIGDAGPVAVDGERVYYATGQGDFAWEPVSGPAFAIAGSLVDSADGARVSRGAEGLQVQPAPFRTGFDLPADDGRLTRDGRYLFVLDQREELVVYDVATGRPLPRMYSPSDRALTWGYVDDGSFLFALQHALQDKRYQDMLQMPSAGNYRIMHCDPLQADPCRELAEVPEAVPDPPIFAR